MFALISLGCSDSDSGSDERFSFLHQGINRFVHVHIPEGYDAGLDTPVLFALHGAGDTGGGFQKGAGLDKEADTYGFIVAYPSASTNNWAEGCNCNRPDLDGVDDVGFMDQVIEQLDERFSIDRTRLFVTGFSQGGMFTQRLACERSGVFRAFSTVAGMISEPLAKVCRPQHPVNLMMINGTNDTVLPFYGIPSGSFATKGAFETLLMWKDRNGCTGSLETESVRSASPVVFLHSIKECDGNTDLKLYELVGGRHEWPTVNVDSPSIITAFFGLDR